MMLDLVLTSIGYAFLAAFWAGIFFASRAAWRAWRTLRHGRCLAFAVFVLVLLWCGLFTGFTPGASAYARYRFSQELFGRGFALGSLRRSYESRRAITGDGYSIEVFEISDAFARWAASPSPEFQTAFPVKPSYRDRWSGVHWHATPIAADERKFLEFALLEQVPNSDLEAAKKLLKRLANEPGHYVAYSFKMNGEFLANVDFFLLSPSERVFISANNNT
jgi:hypothetical protein